MNPVACVLIHGYLGSPADLAPLATALAPLAPVDCPSLPGHDEVSAPAFDAETYLATLSAVLDHHLAQSRDLILLGHSTGGSLLLAELERRARRDAASLARLRLLVLCATPPRIERDYARRWAAHRQGRARAGEPNLDDLGGLLALVNGLARRAERAPLALPMPVLVIHGEADELVPYTASADWSRRLVAPLRRVAIAGAGHHPFSGPAAALAVDAVLRTLRDALAGDDPGAEAMAHPLPELAAFTAAWPFRRRHLAAAPAGRRLLEQAFTAAPIAATEPTLANIEITTRCTLACPACARTGRKAPSRHMPRERFERVLAALPHAQRLRLVGLGEPLLHPEVVGLVRLATADGRRVGLVTNAMALDAAMARALCDAGLRDITFSLDTLEPELAAQLRPGGDLTLIRAHIRDFVAVNHGLGKPVETAVFTALTAASAETFEALVDGVADLGVDAMMVSDLNFPANQSRSLHAGLTPEKAGAIRRGLKRALTRGLPLLSVRGLEEYALDIRFRDYLPTRAEGIAQRATRHGHCLSPWQTVPVNVAGQATVCDCQPEALLGNLLDTPLEAWWNGTAMVEHRRRMLSDNPPPDCLACPRF